MAWTGVSRPGRTQIRVRELARFERKGAMAAAGT